MAMPNGQNKTEWWKMRLNPLEPATAIRALGLGIMFGSYFSLKWGLPIWGAITIGIALICIGHFICGLKERGNKQT
jgi:hypothetical protein